MEIKYFENINFSKIEDYYSTEVKINSKEIEIDLNFENESISKEIIIRINSALSNLENILNKSWEWIIDNYNNEQDVKEFISFHLDDFFEDDPEEILKGTDPELNNKERFLKTLRVNRVGIYPDDEEHFLIIDWMTDPELSNYILVININKNLNLEYITVES